VVTATTFNNVGIILINYIRWWPVQIPLELLLGVVEHSHGLVGQSQGRQPILSSNGNKKIDFFREINLGLGRDECFKKIG
jgi:hypothetical protein